MMEHEEIRRKLAAYLDNAVSPEEKEEIRKHLAMCGRCRGDIADLELTVRYLKSLPEVEPPSWMAESIMAKVREDVGQKHSFWQRLFFPLHIKLPLEAFAVIFICIVGYQLASMIGGKPDMVNPVLESHKPAVRPSPQPDQFVSAPHLPAERRSHVVERKGEIPPVETSPVPEVAPPAPAEKKEMVVQSFRAPSRRAAEPELQTEDQGFMSDREFQFQANGGKSDGAPKLAKKWNAAETAPAAKEGVTRYSGSEEIALVVHDTAQASAAIEDAVTRAGGRIKGRSNSGDTNLLVVRIGAEKSAKFVDRLGRIGTIKERPHLVPDKDGMVNLIIKW